jgi:hypothetical protein
VVWTLPAGSVFNTSIQSPTSTSTFAICHSLAYNPCTTHGRLQEYD